MIKTAVENKDKLMLKSWQKERRKIVEEIKTNYPDLIFTAAVSTSD